MGNCFSSDKKNEDQFKANKARGKILDFPSKRSFTQRLDPWEKTGMVAFRNSGLKEFPPQVERIAKKVRVLDASKNKLREVPQYVGLMTTCHRLGLSYNKLTSLPEEISALENVRVVLLDHNRFTKIPLGLFTLFRLERLSLSHNSIMELPAGIRNLKQLRILDISHNKLAALPKEIGECDSLEEINVANNALSRLPTDLAKLEHLRTVIAENNHISAVPSEILRYCDNLQTLALHGNQLTMAMVEQTDGYSAFEERRKAKWDKNVSGGVLLGTDRMKEVAERKKINAHIVSDTTHSST